MFAWVYQCDTTKSTNANFYRKIFQPKLRKETEVFTIVRDRSKITYESLSVLQQSPEVFPSFPFMREISSAAFWNTCMATLKASRYRLHYCYRLVWLQVIDLEISGHLTKLILRFSYQALPRHTDLDFTAVNKSIFIESRAVIDKIFYSS